jgi:hypothetical protein
MRWRRKKCAAPRFCRTAHSENGVTYNVYADPNGADRPWALDPLPLIIPPDEWAEVSARSPSAPPAQRHAGRPLRPQTCSPKASCHRRWSMASTATCGPATASSRRVASGCTIMPSIWRARRRSLVGHRRPHAGPFGAGYALENRLIVSRVFPEMFRDLHVQHVADFSVINSMAGCTGPGRR